MNKDKFQKELLEAPVSFLVSKWIIDRVPHVFNDDREEYISWKEELAKKLQIDGKAIIFTGSSGCGFSLNPSKNYKDFDIESDIDIALISQIHFDIAWHYLRNLGSSRMGLTSKQKNSIRDHVTRLIYWGTIGTDKILEILPFGVTDRLKRATHDRANGATKKWLNQSFEEGYFLPFFGLVFNDCFCLFESGFGVR